MALQRIASDDPQLVLVYGVSRRMASFPVKCWIEIAIEEGVGLFQGPLFPVGRAPNFVVAFQREMDLVGWIPAAN
jgi:hypothetical protein